MLKRNLSVAVIALASVTGGLVASPTIVGAQAGRAPYAATAAHSTKQVAFSGHYTGTVALLIDNGSLTISAVKGKGTATLVGLSSVQGNGLGSASAQCDPFSGVGGLVGKTGEIKVSVASATSQGCSSGESGPVTITFHGVAKVTGGTGKALGVTGSFKFSGSVNLKGTSGRQTGTFSATLTGKLSEKG